MMCSYKNTINYIISHSTAVCFSLLFLSSWHTPVFLLKFKPIHSIFFLMYCPGLTILESGCRNVLNLSFKGLVKQIKKLSGNQEFFSRHSLERSLHNNREFLDHFSNSQTSLWYAFLWLLCRMSQWGSVLGGIVSCSILSSRCNNA